MKRAKCPRERNERKRAGVYRGLRCCVRDVLALGVGPVGVVAKQFVRCNGEVFALGFSCERVGLRSATRPNPDVLRIFIFSPNHYFSAFLFQPRIAFDGLLMKRDVVSRGRLRDASLATNYNTEPLSRMSILFNFAQPRIKMVPSLVGAGPRRAAACGGRRLSSLSSRWRTLWRGARGLRRTAQTCSF